MNKTKQLARFCLFKQNSFPLLKIVVKFVSDRSVIFSRYSQFSPPINWSSLYNRNIVESGVNHHHTNQPTNPRVLIIVYYVSIGFSRINIICFEINNDNIQSLSSYEMNIECYQPDGVGTRENNLSRVDNLK